MAPLFVKFWTFLVLLMQVPGQTPVGIFGGGVPPISYCTVPGYPAAPESSDTIQLWLSADCINGGACASQPSDGATVTTWTDRSGQGRNADLSSITATFHTNILNGKPAITGSGNAWSVLSTAMPTSTGYTFFQMYNMGASSSFGFAGGRTTGQEFFYVNSRQNSFDQTGQQVQARGQAGAVLSNTWYNTVGEYANTSNPGNLTCIFHLNETIDAIFNGSCINSTPAGPDAIIIGGGGGSGTTPELIYYSSRLSAANIVYNECYLYGKYGR